MVQKIPQRSQTRPVLVWKRRASLRLRRWCSADAATSEDLEDRGVIWEIASQAIGVTERVVVLLDEAIVAVSAAAGARARVQWPLEPIPDLDRAPFLWTSEDDAAADATVGCGLVMHRSLAPGEAEAVHRLVRTLRADEQGHRFCIVSVALPSIPPHPPASVVQQIMHGGQRWLPLEIPLQDGYWPLGIDPEAGTVTCARRNGAF